MTASRSSSSSTIAIVDMARVADAELTDFMRLLADQSVTGLILLSRDSAPKDLGNHLSLLCAGAGVSYFSLSQSLTTLDPRLLIERIQGAPSSAKDDVALEGRTYWPQRTIAFANARSPGKILRQARLTLNLGIEDLLGAMQKRGIALSPETYLRYEQDDRFAREISAVEWLHLCELLEIPCDSISYGYNERAHVERIRNALELSSPWFPLTDPLKARIRELEILEDCESKQNIKRLFAAGES